MRKFMAVIVAAAIALAGCSVPDSQVVDNNIRDSADNFKILRTVLFIDIRNNTYLLQVSGWCNITDQVHQIETICKVNGGYQKHFMGLQSEWVTYVVKQEDPANVSSDFFVFSVKPTALVPIPRLT